ncbi:hypothetical protein [Thiomicrorhabdus sp.]|uniref:hypothetical protein n=1 Tax=Thiomicrorhabdus sp. TaxID=2039724 RepID=UPI003568F08D
MKGKSLIVLAPGHNEIDRRVNRTIDVFSKKFDRIVLIYESRSSLKGTFAFPNNVSVLYVDNTTPKFRALPQLTPFIHVIRDNNLSVDNVYIHDSGLLGLLLANRLRKLYGDGPKISLDYHDFVHWEVHYQLGKFIKRSVVNKLIGSLLLSIFAFYFRRNKGCMINGAVGISKAQVVSLLDWLGNCRGLDYISIPNTREKLKSGMEIGDYPDGSSDFLWIGNIVNGRDLPETLLYLDELAKIHDFKLYVFGKVVSEEVFKLLSAKPYFVYMGEFKQDLDMVEVCQSKKIIGLFFGWDDKYRVGINEISSPNKVYSYVNLGIPVLLHQKVNPSAFDSEYKIGKTFNDFEGFKQSYELVSGSYGAYKDLVLNSKENFVWETDLEATLSQFVDKVYFGASNV